MDGWDILTVVPSAIINHHFNFDISELERSQLSVRNIPDNIANDPLEFLTLIFFNNEILGMIERYTNGYVEYRTKNKEIDQKHKRLCSYTRKLMKGCSIGKPSSTSNSSTPDSSTTNSRSNKRNRRISDISAPNSRSNKRSISDIKSLPTPQQSLELINSYI